MEEKYGGIVLSGINYGENDKILSIFTLEKGTVSANIKGVKKAGAKLKFAQEPFCFAEFIFAKKGERRTVINASLIDSFYPLREDIVKYYSASAVLEYVKKFAKEEIVSAELFTLVINSLKKMAYTSEEPTSVLTDFLIRALSLSGYALSLSGCVNCGAKIENRVFFDSETGSFKCADCFDGKGREIKVSTHAALLSADSGITRQNAKDALRLLEYYIAHKADVKLASLSELDKII